MPSGFLPNSDAALLAWSLNFSTRISAAPVPLGLTAAQATAYAALHGSFADALAACDPGDRSKSLVLAKNAARQALKNSARLLAKLVEGTATVTNAQKIELGLNVRALPTPIPAPSAAPGIDVLSVSGWTVRLRLHDTASGGKRGKPPGVAGASVFSYVGTGPAPADLGGWKFEGNTGRTRIDVLFPSTLAPGTRIWLTAFWFNPRKQSGPVTTPLSTNLQGGMVAEAA